MCPTPRPCRPVVPGIFSIGIPSHTASLLCSQQANRPSTRGPCTCDTCPFRAVFILSRLSATHWRALGTLGHVIWHSNGSFPLADHDIVRGTRHRANSLALHGRNFGRGAHSRTAYQRSTIEKVDCAACMPMSLNSWHPGSNYVCSAATQPRGKTSSDGALPSSLCHSPSWHPALASRLGIPSRHPSMSTSMMALGEHPIDNRLLTLTLWPGKLPLLRCDSENVPGCLLCRAEPLRCTSRVHGEC
ncbi:hypothetical protein CGRA01v4_02508 [Colletotrichum graminicola]|nr:hypothetical protein CGRA01v4_02508 [Colletotrichum graminicola]